mmetsp:Transcript_27098/g.67540  ORF Transcript_27098/g.67540 Transcript_27098/m.67540 type:complete len:459 (+) Transcript_27098:2179-3555(+)
MIHRSITFVQSMHPCVNRSPPESLDSLTPPNIHRTDTHGGKKTRPPESSPAHRPPSIHPYDRLPMQICIRARPVHRSQPSHRSAIILSWEEWQLSAECGGLGQAEHDVEVLDRLAARTLAQVVHHRRYDGTTTYPIRKHVHCHHIAAPHVTRLGHTLGALQHVHKRLRCILVRQGLFESLCRHAVPHLDVHGLEYAPAERHEVGREVDDHRAAGGLRQALLDLGRVPVGRHTVRMHPIGNFAEECVLFGRPAGARDATLGIDDDAVGVDQGTRLMRQQRTQRQLGGRGVATRVRTNAGALHLCPMQLWQPVDSRRLQVWGCVWLAIPLLVSVGVHEAEVSRQVDHLDAGRQNLDELLCLGMRQGAEDCIKTRHIHPALTELRSFLQSHQPRQVSCLADIVELGVHGAQCLPCRPLRGREELDVHNWVVEQQPHQLGPRVPRRTQHAHTDLLRTARTLH